MAIWTVGLTRVVTDLDKRRFSNFDEFEISPKFTHPGLTGRQVDLALCALVLLLCQRELGADCEGEGSIVNTWSLSIILSQTHNAVLGRPSSSSSPGSLLRKAPTQGRLMLTRQDPWTV